MGREFFFGFIVEKLTARAGTRKSSDG